MASVRLRIIIFFLLLIIHLLMSRFRIVAQCFVLFIFYNSILCVVYLYFAFSLSFAIRLYLGTIRYFVIRCLALRFFAMEVF